MDKEAIVNQYGELKSEIYALYMRICKAHFLGKEELFDDSFDKILARVCVCHLDESITHGEFNILSGFLVRTYELYKLERNGN